MSPEDLQTVLAEFRGWTFVHNISGDDTLELYGYPPGAHEGYELEPVPRYHDSLDAVAEIEEHLEEYFMLYIEKLKEVTFEASPHAVSFGEYQALGLEWVGHVVASPQHRAEAAARALGKWTDDE